MKRLLLSMLILVSVLGTRPGAAFARDIGITQPEEPSAPQDTPAVLVNEAFDEYALHAGEVYWDVYCYIIPLSGNEVDMIQRKPVGGGATSAVVSGEGCNRFQNIAVDDSGVYFVDNVLHKIQRVPAGVPNAAPVDVAPAFNVNFIKLDGDFVYFNTYDNRIMRAPKTGGAAVVFVQTDFYLSDFIFNDFSVYWFDNSGLFWAPKTCTVLPCAKQLLAGGVHGKNMRFGNIGGNATTPSSIAYVNFTTGSSTTQSIRELTCNTSAVCQTVTYYTAALNWQIGKFQFIYLPRNNLPILDNYLLWTETSSTGNVGRLLRRIATATSTPSELYTGDAALSPLIYTEGAGAMWGVYFARSPQVMFLPFTASAITRDLMAFNIEVTQGIQNSDNLAPLVAGKRTFVRAYGRQASGPPAGGVEATLTGTRNGAALPGSPLSPINGTLPLAVGKTYDRQFANDGWLFELPASWYTAGSISLRLNVDPRVLYADTNLANNTLLQNVTFGGQPNACLFFSPVRTANPIPNVGDPNFWNTLERFNRVWPTAGVSVHEMGEPIEELQWCSWHGVPYPCFGPYEMDQGADFPSNWPSDKDRVIGKLMLRQIAARVIAPVACDFGASVHSVGLVNPDADTTDAEGTTLGYANLYFNAAWYKMEPYDSTPSYPNWFWPRAASVLAQEVTHNFNRGHINCGNPAGVDTGWPYLNPCQLNDGGQTNYYGFDVKTRAPIAPEIASDFMSYKPSNGQAPLWQGQWVSDYTYKFLYDNHFANAAPAAAPSPNWTSDTNMVAATGAVHVALGLGSIDYAYIQPVAGMTAQAQKVWMEFAAPGFDPSAKPSSANAVYHLRLKDAAGNILDDRTLTLLAPDPHEEDAAHRFVASFPAPAGAATQMELLADGAVLASQSFGPATPAITLVAPTAGSAVNDALTVSWQASDADAGDILHFNIEYSPDGANWIPLAEDQPNFPGQATQSFTLKNPLALAGSTGATARVRVTASDGYHTASATSGAFSVAQRAPIANITTPRADESFKAGVDVPLRGNGFDAESGLLGDSALVWAVDGALVANGGDTSARGLAPGTHTVVLTATDASGRKGVAQTTLKIDPLAAPALASPTLDGVCDDSAYANAGRIQLAPYAGGAQASAAVLRTNTAMWVCLSGLARGSDAQIGRAGVFVDANNSRDPLAQPSDLMLMVGEDGAKISGTGNGSGGYASPALTAYAAQVSAGASAWQAELQIPLSALGGAGHSVGLLFAQSAVNTAGDQFVWPFAGQSAKPNTWAQTALGTPPQLVQMEPASAAAGAGALTLVLTGTNFTTGTVALWNGSALPTAFISATRLSASVSAARLSAAGMVNVQTRDASIPDAPSGALPFAVNNPAPLITALLPNSAPAPGAGFTLVVQGSQFVAGAVVLWDGISLATTFNSSGQLSAVVPAALLDMPRAVQVIVQNPAPGGGASNAAPFTLTDTSNTNRLFLPMLAR
ncbi:MAG TPA: IPT/TIG domain-containing protein [Thermoflexales bacterium]|nr:IPT/TIG domain-containing protein [Thermoflexales bacterium]HQW35166.1 IPT/TIG domain-containing protein [Thermoflexales bacterium]